MGDYEDGGDSVHFFLIAVKNGPEDAAPHKKTKKWNKQKKKHKRKRTPQSRLWTPQYVNARCPILLQLKDFCKSTVFPDHVKKRYCAVTCKLCKRSA
ncbi:hypothetical protein RB195_004278 [Necator americanus]|uniref:ShKT domain-containing protein n=1 Tax=Necator americanus TaxID=51031 RepID=A0ABR1BH71_NECAM